jgi:hypothetical protein
MTSIVPVMIFMGQSNTDGRSFLSEAPWLQNKTFEGIKIFNKPLTRFPANSSVNHIDNGEWVDFAYDKCMVCSPEGTDSFGPELPFAVAWREKHGRPLYIIKCTIGGTSLQANGGGVDTDWSSGTSQIWDIATNYIVRPAIRKLIRNGLTPKCIGYFWGQGESDANATLAPTYQTALASHISRVRSELGLTGVRMLIMQLSDYSADSNWSTVKSGQSSQVSSDSNAILIQTSDTSFGRYPAGVGAGAIHLNAYGLTALGNAIFDSIDHDGVSFTPTQTSIILAPERGRVGSALPSTRFSQDYFGSATETLVFQSTRISGSDAYAWVKSGPKNGVDTKVFDPRVRFVEMDGSSDIEILFTIRWHSSSTLCRPGFWVRANTSVSNASYSNAYSSGYFINMAVGSGGATTYACRKATGTVGGLSHIAASSYPSTFPSTWGSGDNAIGRPHKLTVLGSTITLEESNDGGVSWSTIFSVSDTQYTSGNVYLSAYGFDISKAVSAPYTLSYNYPAIEMRRL